MSISDFDGWRKEYCDQLELEQFLIAGRQKLALVMGNAVNSESVGMALRRLHNHPNMGLEKNPLFCKMLSPGDDSVIDALVFRGEHGNAELLQTRRGAYSFSTLCVAEMYALEPNDRGDVPINPKVLKAKISIFNPVINEPDDPFIDCKRIIDCVGMENAFVIFEELKSRIEETDNFNEVVKEYGVENYDDLVKKAGLSVLNKLYLDAYHVFDKPEFVEMFKEKGYDGLVQGGNGESAMEAEYKVFNKEQIEIQSVTDLQPTIQPERNMARKEGIRP
jgi:hypothetical protein